MICSPYNDSGENRTLRKVYMFVRSVTDQGLAKLRNIVAETMFLVMFPEGWLNWET